MTKNILLPILNNSRHFSTLPESDPYLKQLLNYNLFHNQYTEESKIPGRNLNETDRGGWRGYDRVYSHYLSHLKNTPVNLLEIGIHYGYGHLTWQRYFTEGTISGIDNNFHRDRLQEWESIEKNFPEFKKVRKVCMNSTIRQEWSQNFHKVEFDIIIDDGGHKPDIQISTFNCAWSYLKPGGRYFIEDVTHRFGDLPLFYLHNLLEKLLRDGHLVEVYNHTNDGLAYHYKSFKARKQHEIDPSANDPTEYIICIKKNG